MFAAASRGLGRHLESCTATSICSAASAARTPCLRLPLTPQGQDPLPSLAAVPGPLPSDHWLLPSVLTSWCISAWTWYPAPSRLRPACALQALHPYPSGPRCSKVGVDAASRIHREREKRCDLAETGHCLSLLPSESSTPLRKEDASPRDCQSPGLRKGAVPAPLAPCGSLTSFPAFQGWQTLACCLFQIPAS